MSDKFVSSSSSPEVLSSLTTTCTEAGERARGGDTLSARTNGLVVLTLEFLLIAKHKPDWELVDSTVDWEIDFIGCDNGLGWALVGSTVDWEIDFIGCDNGLGWALVGSTVVDSTVL